MYRFLRLNAVNSDGLIRMALFKTYWTVEGISPEARKAARRAADASGEELGAWLTRLINKVSLSEREPAVPHLKVEAEAEDPADNKLSSIERAMQQSRAGRDA